MLARIKPIVHLGLPAVLVFLTVPSYLNAIFYPFLEWNNGILQFFRNLTDMMFALKLLLTILCIAWAVFIIIEGGGYAVIVEKRYGNGEPMPLVLYGIALILFFVSIYLDVKFAAFWSLPPDKGFGE